MKKEFEIKTTLPIEEIEKRVLKLINTPFRLFFIFKMKQYSGSFQGSSFKIEDTSAPPVILKGTVLPNEGKVKIVVNWDSMKKMMKGFIYALLYPMLGVVIFLMLYYYHNFFSYLFSFILLFVPYVFFKWYSLVYIVEPNPKKLIKDIKKALN